MPPSDEPLLEVLDKADAGIAPSPFGKLTVEVAGAPVSVEESRSRRLHRPD